MFFAVFRICFWLVCAAVLLFPRREPVAALLPEIGPFVPSCDVAGPSLDAALAPLPVVLPIESPLAKRFVVKPHLAHQAQDPKNVAARGFKRALPLVVRLT